MGTRADFYVGQGESAEWLGSIAWDGHPGSVFDEAPEMFVEGQPVTEAEWRRWVAEYLAGRDDATLPEQGWPWPWDNSQTTDYAYALDQQGQILGCAFGYGWFALDPDAECFGEPELELERPVAFPNMASRKAVTYGPRSGVIVVSLPVGGEPL